MEPVIELRGVTKRFATPKGGIYTALRELNMEVAAGEFCAVVGPTGCGKSTTLALVSGLERPSMGEVRVAGQPVNGIPDGIGYVFQTDAVFPWKTVWRTSRRGRDTMACPAATPGSGRGNGSHGWDWPASRTAIPTSFLVACASASGSPRA